MAVTLTGNSLILPTGTLFHNINRGLRILGAFNVSITPGLSLTEYDTGIRVDISESGAIVGERFGSRGFARYVDLGFFYFFSDVTGGSAATESGRFGMRLGSTNGIWVRGFWPSNPTYNGQYIFMDLRYITENTVPTPATVTIIVTHINAF